MYADTSELSTNTSSSADETCSDTSENFVWCSDISEIA
ncbi:hypothetical protein PC120_g18556 [Phytophthora cactorum]|nr:hypothetical protein PC120_g18556 [Phytophthora cactorum]